MHSIDQCFLAVYREGHVTVAKLLLDHNTDVELPDNYGQSPLFMACWKGNINYIYLLNAPAVNDFKVTLAKASFVTYLLKLCILPSVI